MSSSSASPGSGPDFNQALRRNANVFGNQHPVGGIINGQGGEVDFTYNGNDWPTVPGLPGPLQLHEGFNAVCAAQTYYHRPGDWQADSPTSSTRSGLPAADAGGRIERGALCWASTRFRS